MIALAFVARAGLSIYNCLISYEQQQSQIWRFYVIYYIDVAFMTIYLTAIFRVVGTWTLFQEIKIQSNPSLLEIFSEGRTEFVRKRVSRLNNWSMASLAAYMLLDAQYIGIQIAIANSKEENIMRHF